MIENVFVISPAALNAYFGMGMGGGLRYKTAYIHSDLIKTYYSGPRHGKDDRISIG